MGLKKIAICLVTALALASGPALAREYSIKSHERIELFGVYWVQNCRSVLKSFGGIDKLEGPGNVTLGLRRGMVHAYRQRCPRPIHGATVVVHAGAIKAHHQATLTFRVRYNTVDGSRQSTHTVTLDMYP